MAPVAVHRELTLPNPAVRRDDRPPARPGIGLSSTHVSSLELHRGGDGGVRFLLGAPSSWELNLTLAALGETFPGAQLGAATTCPIQSRSAGPSTLLRAIPREPCHYWPLHAPSGADWAGLLLQSLSAPELRGQEIVLQFLFQRVPVWESGFFSSSYPMFAEKQDERLQPRLRERAAEPAYHVEIRAGLLGPAARHAYSALFAWLRQWTSIRGVPWWSLESVTERKRARFYEALQAHDIQRFAGRKIRRDISGSDLAHVLPIPWREQHAELAYAGAPASGVPAKLVARSKSPHDLAVGMSSGEPVRLPPNWNHLAILGKTRSGKSTLAENVVLQILAKQPNAKVVVLEPTGNLIRSIIGHLPAGVASDTVEIDPSRPTFHIEGAEMASVPLNLLQLPGRGQIGDADFERRAERLAGDLIQSFKNAWGEESIGGRADFILRAVLQGLLAVEGTNLVDAYTVLSDKQALRRLESLSRGGLLKSALRVHLPKLDYSFTISSLDKVGKIATNPVLRKALAQRFRPVSFDQLLDHQLLLLNLGKGSLGVEGSNFLGAIFLSQLWSALQERERTDLPVYLVVDEFHNYAIPAFADMLSEGARLGLHVVAITQYLNRIPPKVRSSLLGNVDAWAFFPLGADDMKDAWNIAQGAKFGWTPDHFVSGLGPHQAAFATRGALLKVTTDPPPPDRVECEVESRRVVEASTRRYARREDSESSPLGFSQKRLATFLGAFPELAGRTRDELARQLGWPATDVDAAIALGKSTGDLIEAGEAVGLRVRGLFHREAIDAARNEGEEHCGLLADAAAFLSDKGVRVRVVPQEGGYLLPDAEFDWRGRTYSVEVECSTLVKRADQAIRNVRKAHARGRRCLVVTSDREMAEHAVVAILGATPTLRLWDEFGVTWRNGAQLTPAQSDPAARPWTFQLDSELPDSGNAPAEFPDSAIRPLGDSSAGDLALAEALTRQLIASGRTEATGRDFLALIPPGEWTKVDERRLGMALRSIGLRSHRLRLEGERVRVYDLRSMSGPPNSPTAPAGASRTGGLARGARMGPTSSEAG